MTIPPKAWRLPANPVPVYYAGGENIDRFRGTASTPPRPEDWIGATTALPEMILPRDAPRDSGVSRLPDGRSLRDAVSDDRIDWLGPNLAGRFSGGETGLLVKLLDAGERLPVHAHPDRAFARKRLGSPFGKTEGWIVMDDAPGGDVWLGFREDVDLGQLRRWIEDQAVDEMLTAMNRLPARPGAVFYVPAGVPHAIGPGVMITELQEPTSFSILAEFKAFGLDATQATLGLGWADAIECFDRSGYSMERLSRLQPRPHTAEKTAAARVSRLFGDEAAPFFRALRVETTGRWTMPESFAILIIEEGAGVLETSQDPTPIARGETWVVPFDITVALNGNLRCLVCLPPSAE
jgi:mannose-6-phosphate isomerase